MDNRSHSSVRVLVRPPTAPTPPPPPISTPTPPLTSVQPEPSGTPQNGVVVVGFIGNRSDDLAQLINKVIDSNVFGSGTLDTSFRFEEPEIARWLDTRKLSFYHDQGKGILFVQFSPTGFGCGLRSDDQELGDLQGLLFMFSVCHVVILVQEGSRFETQMLQKFRVVQAAKHAITSHFRSQNLPPTTSRERSSASPWMSSSGASPSNPTPGKIRGRNGSTITVMSGLGTHTSLLPGQCIPVILFVFLDDFTEIQPNGSSEEPSETSINSSASLTGSARVGPPIKGPGSVVVLARPTNKSESGPKKKLQSSLEAQIRFSIKKCRTLSVSESSHTGLRSGATSNSAPLFSLDASKAVSLVDACSCQSGESLEFAISLVEEVLEGKATPDSLLLESHHKDTKKEDIISLNEFIYKQADILRGKSGMVATNSGSAGIGMAAVAAAAAAASVGSGKKVNAPALPSLEMWSSSCQLILHEILSRKHARTKDADSNLKSAGSSQTGNLTSSDPFRSAVSHLENGIGMNTRFSTLWCEKAFPVAKEVYLDDLPPCYPSAQHEDHLKKAILALISMVKGPSVQLYLKKLKDECTSIWSSGRQQCDAISLTGNPCIHQRHENRDLLEEDVKLHSSGFVYLHACACGRSRSLRPDPFDYDTANVAFNVFADCDKLLPTAKFPEGRIKEPIQPSNWHLVRIGGARYYDPSKGLLQSGFCATQKFLLKWTISEKLNEDNRSLVIDFQRDPLERNVSGDIIVDATNKISHADRVTAGVVQDGIDSRVMPPSDVPLSNNKNMNFGRALSNFSMKKPFSEVVAGPASANSGFPPLFSRKQPLLDPDRGVKLHLLGHLPVENSGVVAYNQESKKAESASVDNVHTDNSIAGDKLKDGHPFLHIGSVPLNMTGKQIKVPYSTKHVTTYVGFEHECPRGHRFIINLDHLDELGPSYAVTEENDVPLSVENSDRKQDYAKFAGQGRTRRQSNGTTSGGGIGKTKSLDKLKEKVANGNMHSNKARLRKDQNGRLKASQSVKELDSDIKASPMEDVDFVYSLLNRSLPVYMNCPHCRDSTANDASKVKVASTVSQLQRIFVVTPSFPIILAANPVIQFEVSCLPPSVPDREQKLQFSLGCPMILPPDSFISLRLPFVYGVKLDDGSLCSLKPFENQPQLTAWIMKGTSLQVVSQKVHLDLGSAI